VRGLFPEREPYTSFRMRVSDLHELHVEEAGTPDGAPVLFMHGGPGAGISPIHRRFFDPSHWRVVLFDQRGSGKSTPLGELRDNTTWDLVDDAERIRERLGIESWLVFGGSWGSTLALAYAEAYPARVKGMVLRGIFLSRRTELEWTFVDGARRIFPDGWDEFVAPLTLRERGDVPSAYHRKLTSDDPAVRREAALSWNLWEERASKLVAEPKKVEECDVEHEIAIARIEAHYFVNRGFLETDDQLLRDVPRIRHIPAVIVQGRYDVVCPAESAWALHRAWPEAELVITADSGHSAFDAANSRALVAATDRFAERWVPAPAL